MSKTITKDEYYKALGLFLVAKQKQQQVDELEREMNKILNQDLNSHASDAIYNYNQSNPMEQFNTALERMNIEVEEDNE